MYPDAKSVPSTKATHLKMRVTQGSSLSFFMTSHLITGLKTADKILVTQSLKLGLYLSRSDGSPDGFSISQNSFSMSLVPSTTTKGGTQTLRNAIIWPRIFERSSARIYFSLCASMSSLTCFFRFSSSVLSFIRNRSIKIHSRPFGVPAPSGFLISKESMSAVVKCLSCFFPNSEPPYSKLMPEPLRSFIAAYRAASGPCENS